MGTVGGPHEDEVVMRRWMGVSAAVGSATAAALTGSAWAGTPATAVPAQRVPPSAAHQCGHEDTIAVSSTAGELRVDAVDGVADPVEGSFGGTTVRVRIPGQRTATGSGSPSAGATAALPTADDSGAVELRIDATFDDGITSCSWTTHVQVPPPA